MAETPLKNLNGKKLGPFVLCLGEVKQLRLSGWRGFTLFLKDKEGLLADSPLIKGIFSAGGKDGVKPWMDIIYREEVSGARKGGECRVLSLDQAGMDRELFQILGKIIPPGGHIMVSYEEEQGIHRDTLRALNVSIPPCATPLGFLLFQAGFQYIKNWYLSEGGFEGPRKLWAEKAQNRPSARLFCEKTAEQVKGFLDSEPSLEGGNLDEEARKRAESILRQVTGR